MRRHRGHPFVFGFAVGTMVAGILSGDAATAVLMGMVAAWLVVR